MNASMISRKSNPQDTLLQDFVARQNLSWRQTGEETFFHPNKADKAEIDYVFFNKLGSKAVEQVRVDRNNQLNTSDHIPVKARVNVEFREKSRSETTVIQVKPKWDKCDKAAYKRTEQNLLQFDAFLPSLSKEMDILLPLAHLNSILKGYLWGNS